MASSPGSQTAEIHEATEPQEGAPGVFFLQGGTRYFREGTVSGPAGSIGSLMCNNGWVILDDGVLLIDANMPGRAEILLAAIRSTTSKPVRYLFNTHHHGDHCYGNRAIVERTGAAVIAHEGMLRELQHYETGYFGGAAGRWEQVAQLRPDVAASPLLLPEITFESKMTLESGGCRVEFLHLGLGHTRGDGVVWLPREGVVFAGDLVTNGAFNIVRDSEMEAWVGTLAAMQQLAPSIVCPGHGSLGNATTLSRQRAFFVSLIVEVRMRLEARQALNVVLDQIDEIRDALLANPAAAPFVIPREADLPVLSLRAQVERTYQQLQNA